MKTCQFFLRWSFCGFQIENWFLKNDKISIENNVKIIFWSLKLIKNYFQKFLWKKYNWKLKIIQIIQLQIFYKKIPLLVQIKLAVCHIKRMIAKCHHFIKRQFLFSISSSNFCPKKKLQTRNEPTQPWILYFSRNLRVWRILNIFKIIFKYTLFLECIESTRNNQILLQKTIYKLF